MCGSVLAPQRYAVTVTARRVGEHGARAKGDKILRQQQRALKEPGEQQAWLDPTGDPAGDTLPSDSNEAPEQTQGDEMIGAGDECTHGRGRGEAGHAPEHGGEVAGGAGSAPDLGFGRLAERESAAESGPRDRRGGARADRMGCVGGGERGGEAWASVREGGEREIEEPSRPTPSARGERERRVVVREEEKLVWCAFGSAGSIWSQRSAAPNGRGRPCRSFKSKGTAAGMDQGMHG